jgi:ribonuclease E
MSEPQAPSAGPGGSPRDETPTISTPPVDNPRAAAGTGSPGSEAASRPDGAAPPKRRRRGSRGGRNRSRSRTAGDAEARAAGGNGEGRSALPDDLPDRPIEGRPLDPAAAERALVRRPDGSAPGAGSDAAGEGRRPQIGDTRPAPPPPPKADASADREGGSGDVPRRRRRRRGSRGRGEGSGDSKQGGRARPVEPVLADDDPIELDPEQLERRRGRERKGRPVGRYLMCVHVQPPVPGARPEQGRATQIAVLEGRALIEHYVSRPADDVSQIHGNIYLGRVQNVLPGMEAAFVDIGTPKNAVLYRGDVQFDPEDVEEKGQARIEQLLKARQTIVCQVTKNPIGTKGARLTQEVSLPGRFVVLVPNSTTYGISKRLSDDERKRLRGILEKIRPAGHGVIVRTAAENVTAEELARDVARLTKQWERIDALAKRSAAPALLYREPDMAVRVIREEFNADYRGVVIDDRDLYEEVRDYVASISPTLADRVEYFDPSAEPLPIFERFHVHEQLHKALDRKVWLPSGGSLIVEHTEALTVIDVNTGKNVGTSSLEETVFRNNLEAAIEVARQLRLRDIGGIIVVDFIDMEVRENRDEVVRVFRDALARDKTRTQVFEISDLGLVEMTRKRIGEGLLESFSLTCPTCNGRGVVFDDKLLGG